MPKRPPKPDPFVTRWRDARRAIVAAEKLVKKLYRYSEADPLYYRGFTLVSLSNAREMFESFGRAVTARATDAAKARGR